MDSEILPVLAIDPGTTESGVCLVLFRAGHAPQILESGKLANRDVLSLIADSIDRYDMGLAVVIERVASYGMAVGAEVFETCEWIGRFTQYVEEIFGREDLVQYVYRKDEKLAICHSPKANDATIRQALIDRYAKGVRNYGKGTKKEPGFFYGFKADAWMAFAVAVTFADRYEGGKFNLWQTI